MIIGTRNHDFGRYSIEELPKMIREKGFGAAQLVLPKAFIEIGSYEEATPDILRKIKESFDREGIRIGVLGCYMDFGNPDEKVRKKAVETFKRVLAYGKELKAETIGTETAFPRLTEEEKKIWYPYMIDSLEQIVEEAERINQKIGLEPVHWHPLDTAEVTEKVFKKFNSKYLKMIFDPVNLLKFKPEVDQKLYLQEWIDKLGNEIDVLHTKNFTRDEKGQYCPSSLEEGIIDYTWIFRWLKKNRPDTVIIREEIQPKNCEKDVRYIKELWENC